MEYNIYSYGSGEALRMVFNAIAMTLNGGIAKGMFVTGSTLGLLITMMSAFMQQAFMPLIRQWFVPTFLAMNLLFIPTTSVKIIDPVLRFHDRIDHVPYGLAFVASLFSHLGHELTVLVEKTFSTPQDLSYQKTGTMFASQLMTTAMTMRITNEDVNYNIREFVGQCVIYEAMLGRKYTAEDLRKSDQLWPLIKDNASAVRSVSYKVPRQQPKIISCREAAQRLEVSLVSEVDKAFTTLGKTFYKNTQHDVILANTIRRLLPCAFTTITQQAQQSAKDLMTQLLMTHSVVDSLEHRSVTLGNAPQFAARKAYLQQRTTWQASGEMAKSLYPVLKSVMEAILYSLFIFLIPLSLIQLGLNSVLQWVRMVLWVNLWPPLSAILNGMSLFGAIQSSSSIVGEGGLTIANSVAVLEGNADWMAICGYLMLFFVPTLSWVIVSGSYTAISHMAASLTGGAQSTLPAAAQEALTGNLSFGNIQAMNTSGYTWNTGQHNDTLSYASGSLRMNDGHVDHTLSADGTMIANVARSQFPTTVNVADSQSQQLSDQYQSSLTAAENHTLAAQESVQSAYRSMIEEGLARNKNMSYSHGLNESLSSQSQGTSQTLATHVENFAKSNNISTSDASSMMAGINAGLKVSNIVATLSGSGSGSTESRASLEETIQKAQDYTNQHQLQHQFIQGIQEAKENKYHESDDTSKRHQEAMTQSWDDAQNHRKEASANLSRAEALQHQISYVQSHAATINRDATQDVMEWMSTQSVDGTGRAMGSREAIRIAHQDPGLFQAYASRYLQEKGLSPAPSIPKDQQIQDHYQQFAQHVPSHPTTKPIVLMDSKAYEVSDHGLNERIHAHQSSRSHALEERDRTLSTSQKSLEKAYDSVATASTVKRVGSHVIDNIVGVVSSMGSKE